MEIRCIPALSALFLTHNLHFASTRLQGSSPMSFPDTGLAEIPAQRRAKIVATLGPASNTEAVVRDLVRAGVDVLRLNFSHSTHERKLAVIKLIRKVSREERKPLCI